MKLRVKYVLTQTCKLCVPNFTNKKVDKFASNSQSMAANVQFLLAIDKNLIRGFNMGWFCKDGGTKVHVCYLDVFLLAPTPH